MTIYYNQDSYIAADRYDTVPNFISNAVSNVPFSSTNIKNLGTIMVSNRSTTSNLSALESSKSFGYDSYIYNKTQYKPIFILYNKFYQN